MFFSQVYLGSFCIWISFPWTSLYPDKFAYLCFNIYVFLESGHGQISMHGKNDLLWVCIRISLPWFSLYSDKFTLNLVVCRKGYLGAICINKILPWTSLYPDKLPQVKFFAKFGQVDRLFSDKVIRKLFDLHCSRASQCVIGVLERNTQEHFTVGWSGRYVPNMRRISIQLFEFA